MRIDLDAELAAKAEVEEDSHVIVLHEHEFTIPAKAPFTFLEATLTSSNTLDRVFLAARAILGDQWDEFVGIRPTVDEAQAFVINVVRMWGLGDSLGESPASGGSSRPTSGRSKRTSNSSTASTSPKRSGGRTP